MTVRTSIHRLQVATSLQRFIDDEVLPGTGMQREAFWRGFDTIVHELAPKNAALLAERERLQSAIDGWHRAHPGPIRNLRAYRSFLQQVGYLVPVPAQVKATTRNVDAELALQAGPQLVVPITNARYALNAANARWGSLYDALYGTDALPEDGGATRGPGYNPVRGAKVIEYARYVLDRCAPLRRGSHIDSTGYAVVDHQLAVTLKNGSTVGLKNPAQFVGFQGEMSSPSAVLLSHHGLHLDIRIDRSHVIGATDPAGSNALAWVDPLEAVPMIPYVQAARQVARARQLILRGNAAGAETTTAARSAPRAARPAAWGPRHHRPRRRWPTPEGSPPRSGSRTPS